MTTNTWTTNTSANWTTAADWSAGAAPGSTDTAVFNVDSGATYNTTISTNVTIGALNFQSSVGTLVWSGAGKLTTGSINLSAGTIKFSVTTANLTVTNGVTISGTGTFNESASGGSSFPTFGSLSVSGGSFLEAGTATTHLTVTGAADFTGGTATISNGIMNFGTLIVDGSNNTVSLQGGTVTANTGPSSIVASDTLIIGGGTVAAIADFTNGGLSIANNGTVKGAGTLKGALTGFGSGVVRASGGTLELTSNIAGSSGLIYTIGTVAGSVLQIDGSVGSINAFTFASGSTGALEINNSSSNQFNGTVSGLTEETGGASTVSGSDYINIQQLPVTSVEVTGTSGNVFNGTATSFQVYNGATLIETINLGSAPTAGTFVNWGTASSIGSGIATGTDIFLDSAVCFARGTLIRTPGGDVAVEALAAGDMVMTLDSAALVARPVRWVGYRHVDLRRHPQVNLAAPVQIAPDALGKGLPQRTLVVSPDHCLFVDGKLIPAKLLINDTTITQLRDLPAVEYFHLELDQHAVLLAEGLPAESYLDTGNRAFFSNAGLAVILHPEFHVNAGLRCWDTDACAPLAVSPAAVEPVWRRLAERAQSLGYQLPVLATTTDPEPRLVADGRALRPISHTDGRLVFTLPQGVRSVRLTSRASVPSYRKPYLDDWRSLGVAVSHIVLRSGTDRFDLPVDHPNLVDGWHAVEREGAELRRWTNGNADLPVGSLTEDGPAVLEVFTTCGHVYLLDQAEAPQSMAA